jgi:hypothetical protein
MLKVAANDPEVQTPETMLSLDELVREGARHRFPSPTICRSTTSDNISVSRLIRMVALEREQRSVN